MVSRAERTPFAAWWWTIDRFLLVAIAAIMLGGIVLSLAASPPVAARLGLDAFYFVHRHVLYLVPAVGVMIMTSFLSPRHIRRLALMVFILSFVMVIATLFIGAEVKGARRWIVLAGVNIQPSEFLKPAFVILISWLFAESARKSDVPATTFSLMLLIGVVGVLVLQPDFGQTMLVALVWGALFFMAGMRFIWVIGLGGTAQADHPDHPHAGEEEQGAPDQQDQHGLSEIGLQHQNAHGGQQQRQRRGVRGHFRPPRRFAEQPGDQDDEGGLEEFRGLNVDAEDDDPAARPLDLGAEHQRRHDQDEAHDEDDQREAPNVARRQERGRQQQGERRGQEKDMPIDEVERLQTEPRGHRGACRKRQHDARQHEDDQRRQHQPVDRPPPGRKGSTFET